MKAERAGRRTFLERHLGNALEQPVLEIGAADNPTYWPAEGPVRYLDIYSTEELREQYRSNRRRNLDHLVEVDYVLGAHRVDEVVSERFGLVIANHVIEHVPDLLGWLRQIRRVTLDDGYLFLSVPDRRYTFDYLRRTTDVIDLLERSARGESAPDPFTQLRGVYYYRPVRADAAWSGDVSEAVRQPRFTLRQAVDRVRRQVDRPSDIHCHVFTYQSFVKLWRELERAELVSWRLAHSADVAAGDNEFRVLLSAGRGEPAELRL